MKKNAAPKKLQLSRETLGSLKQSQLLDVRGGTGDEIGTTSNDTHYKPCCACA